MISDNFNRPNQAGIGTASDGGTWTTIGQQSAGPEVDADLVISIVNNQLRLSEVIDGTSYFGVAAREIPLPPTPTSYEFSIDVVRYRNPPGNRNVTLYLANHPRIQFDQAGSVGYEFNFELSADYGRIVQLGPGTYEQSPGFSAGTAWTTGEARRFTVRRVGDAVQALVNGALLMNWTPDAPLEPTPWAVIPNQDYFDRLDNFEGKATGAAVPTAAVGSGAPRGARVFYDRV